MIKVDVDPVVRFYYEETALLLKQLQVAERKFQISTVQVPQADLHDPLS